MGAEPNHRLLAKATGSLSMKTAQKGCFRLHQVVALSVAMLGFITAGVLSASPLDGDTIRLSPSNVSVESSPGLPPEAQALEAQSAANAFDRNTLSEHTAFDSSSVIARLESATEIRALKLFGAAPYILSVAADVGGTWEPITGLQNLNLAARSEAWHTFNVAAPVITARLRFELQPTSGSSAAGLKAVEIWGQGGRINVRDGLSLLAALRGTTPPAHAKLFGSSNSQGVIGGETDDPADNIFAINLDADTAQIKHAYLAYEIIGLAHWVAAPRSINGSPELGGLPLPAATDWSTQVEPLQPGWLRRGENSIVFAPAAAGPYTVRNVYLVAEFDNGANFVGAVSANQPEENNPSRNVLDGDLASGWAPYPSSGGQATPTLSFAFDKPTQLDGVAINLSNPLKGSLNIETLRAGTWTAAGSSIDAKQLGVGWNRLPVPGAAAAEGARLVFSGGQGSGTEIKEVQVVGSGVGTAFAPRFVTGYPDAGQYFGRTAYIRGFFEPLANASGAAQIFVGAKEATSVDGAFAVNVSKDEVGLVLQADADPWTVELRAVYPDGETVTTTLKLNNYQAPLDLSDGSRMSTYRQSFAPGQIKKMAYAGAVLELSADALAGERTIGITPLADIDLPALDMGMTNVTKAPRRGYRFTPTPSKFNKKIKVTLPYNRNHIPAGLTEDDVRTFYFDTQLGSWQALERVAVDKVAETVTSYTDHFTDMINATITVPDHPQAASFNPTLIKDIKAADPGAQINLIEPPKANNTGDARLSYPIEVPPGRSGLQPQLAVQYNSSGGNGWMGMGWDIPLQAITIDTRWGVPRYDVDKESETYVLNGEQLTPLAHRSELVPRTPEKKVFHTRVEGQFREIVRYGSSPKDYTWVVKDKNGTQYRYGAVDPANERLTDGAGNIFLWALSEIRDTNGNFIKFRYAKVSDVGVTGGTVPGSNLYLQKITYTGHGSAEGQYAVDFIRDRDLNESRRSDVQIDARGGFKRVTADLLRQVRVTFAGANVRSYEFRYNDDPYGDRRPALAFNKTLLTSISQFGADSAFFNKHTLRYYDEARDRGGNYHGFAGATNWNIRDDGIGIGLMGRGTASALGGTQSTSAGGHIYLGFGTPPDVFSKVNSAGPKVGYNRSQSETLITMADMNGDGLPDKVFKGGDGFFYRPNQSGPKGAPSFGDTPIKLPGLSAIARERVTSTTVGVESYFGLPVMVDTNSATTQGDTYFSDVNGDGLTDVVSGGQVLFGYLNAAGSPTFSANSFDTPVPIGGGAIETQDLLENPDAIEAERAKNFPLLDTLRRWVAPYDGVVSINAPVRLIEDTSEERAQYANKADGVRVAIQLEGGELWSTTIGKDDYTQKTPVGVDSIPVRKGHSLYFRVQSVYDGAYDQVAWDPEITYVGVDTTRTDVNDLHEYRYTASNDFTFVGRGVSTVTVPVTGTLHLGGRLEKTGATTDDVTLLITHNGTEVYRRALGFAETTTVDISHDLAVSQLDVIEWRILVDSPIDATRIRLAPAAWYTAADGVEDVVDEKGNYVLKVDPPYDMELYLANILTAPQEFYTVPAPPKLPMPPLPVQARLKFSDLARGEVKEGIFTVKRRGALLAKRSISVTGTGVLAETGEIAPIEVIVSAEVSVAAGEQLFFDITSRDASFADKLSLEVTVGPLGTDPNPVVVPSALHLPAPGGLFPQPYRGWGVAGYHGNSPRDALAIDQSLLTLKSDTNSENLRAYAFFPRPGQGLWGGVDELAWVKPGSMSSSRFGLDDIRMPRGKDFAGASAPARISKSNNVSASIGVGGSTGTSESQLEFMDLNGDRFPDVLSNGGVQFSQAAGGLEGKRRITGPFIARQSSNESWNLSTSGAGSIATAIGDMRAGISPFGVRNAANSKQGSDMPSLGFGGDVSKGTSQTEFELTDVNGDGLPDKVFKNGTVQLNLGYSFTDTAEPWGGGIVNDGHTLNGGVNLGFNLGFYSLAGGLNLGLGTSRSDETYVDINGDGLPDKVIAGKPFTVRFNKGNGFSGPVLWPGGHEKVAADKHISLGGGAYFTFGFILIPIAPVLKIVINPGVNASTSMGRPEVAFRDMDGDGFVDHVFSERDRELSVAANPIGRTNLLKRVERPLGAAIDLEYTRDGNTYEIPQSRWLLTKVSVSDGHVGDGADKQVTTYRYETPDDKVNPPYNRLEREFYGYAKVVEEQRDTAANDALYRAVEREFRNDSYYTKGLLDSERTVDAQGNPFTETRNHYVLKNVGNGAVVPDAIAQKEEVATIFPQLVRTDRRFFEGQKGSPGKSTYTEHDYDDFGNVVRFFDAGDSGAADDVEATIAYSANETACLNNYLVGTPTKIEVLNGGKGLRRREATLDCTNGDLLQVRQYLQGNTAAVTDLAYEPNGNLKSVTGPANANGQRYRLDYTYDPTVETHVASIIDSFGYRSTATHDLRFGKVATTTDLNNKQTSYVYDAVGRVQAITGPYQTNSGRATLTFTYAPDARVPYALTEHIDQDAAGNLKANGIETILFVDGIKRVIQTKKDITLHTGPSSFPQAAMSVSGHVVFDAFGRSIAQSYPSAEGKGNNTIFNEGIDSVPPTHTAYDVLDRPLSTTLPDGSTTSIAYGFGPDRDGVPQFETVVTDANGQKKATYRDVRELITAVKEPTSTATLWTSYAYDALKQIVRVEDDKRNVTRVDYDGLGRRTAIDNPDTGKTETEYDLAGNVVAKTTANLRSQLKAVRYEYDFNRLTAVRYPQTANHDVTYTYGAPGAKGNRAGRITRVDSPAGAEERWYGPLGELIQQTRTVASATQGNSVNSPEIYTTAWHYDTWNRLQRIAYPDGEVVTYGYDSGGLLATAVGEKAGVLTPYLRRLEYDKFEQRALLEAGNRLVSQYAYDPLTRRLCALNTAPAGQAGSPVCSATLEAAPIAGSSVLQNLHYAYDPVGNILGLANAVQIPTANAIGGPSLQRFGYDDLYRLTSAQGHYRIAPEKEHRYSLAMGYDSVHNITSKNQSHTLVQGGSPELAQKKTSYLWAYDYGSSRPHAPTHIGERAFSYDANGNQTAWTHDDNGTRRSLTWDEDNRLLEVADNGQTTRFIYDEGGNRVIKRGPQGETAYVNQFYTVRNRAVGTKHVFAGSTRIAARMVLGTGNGATGPSTSLSTASTSLSTTTLPRLSADQPGSGAILSADRANSAAQRASQTTVAQVNLPGSRGLVGRLLTQEVFPGLGIVNRSAQANEVAQNTVKNPNLVGRVAETGGGLAPPPEDNFLYFYHPDHLGSTNLVTDVSGKAYEHLEYFPFGETWVQEHSNTQRTPYLFTGKELDEETNLYYFGARYYDPRTSVWQSADPILGDYINGSPNRGVFYSQNMALYAYGHNNPVLLRDPDGRAVETPWDVFNVGVGVASLGYNLHEGNYGWAAIDALGLAYDGVATAVPFLPAGASAGLKAYRAGNAIKDSVSIGRDVSTAARYADKAVKAAKDAVGTAATIGTKIHQETGKLLGEVAGSASKLSDEAASFFKGANKTTGKQPDLSWPGSGVWADLTTKGSWGNHVSKYKQQFGEGVSLLYERGKGLVDTFRLRTGAGTVAAGGQAAVAANAE
jgi:RHS repeat-associated protein